MNDNQNNLLEKMKNLEENLQKYDCQINILKNKKQHYEKQFLEISRELSNSILFENIKSEVNSK